MIEIVLLGKPVAKGRPRFNRESGRAYTPEKTRTYEQMLRLAAEDAMKGAPPLEGPLRVEMTVVAPIPKSWPAKRQAAALAGEIRPTSKPDWDNFGKVVDAGNLVLWVDDGQIVDGRVVKFYGDRPRMEIRVHEVRLSDTTTPDKGVFE